VKIPKKIVYKVVAKHHDGRLTSVWVPPSFLVEYKLGEPSRAPDALHEADWDVMAFTSLSEAKHWAAMMVNKRNVNSHRLAVFEALGTGVRNSPGVLNYDILRMGLRRALTWFKRYEGARWTVMDSPVDGAVLCTTITLRKELATFSRFRTVIFA